MLRQCKVAHGSSGNTSNPFSPHLSSWTPGGAPSAHALRSVLSSSRPALCVPSAGRVQLAVQAREVCDTIPTSPTPTYLSSQDENKDVGSSSNGGKQQTGSREDEQEAVRRSLRDALLQRGAKPSSSSDGGKEGSSKEGKPFQFQTPRRGGGPPGMGGGGSPFRPSPAKILAGHAAYTGLVGTLALIIAAALRLDLFDMFRWQELTAYNQMLLALGLSVPLQAANLTIMGPSWSAWKLPKLAQEEEKLEETLASVSKGRGGAAATEEGAPSSTSIDGSSRVTSGEGSSSSTEGGASRSGSEKKLASGTSSSSSSSSTASSSDNGAVNEANGAVSEANGAVSEGNGAVSEANGAVSEADSAMGEAEGAVSAAKSAMGGASSSNSNTSGSASGNSSSSSSESQPGIREVPLGTFKPPLDGKLPTKVDEKLEESRLRMVPASTWGAGGANQQPSKPVLGINLPSRKSLRDALHLAQGYYVANNSTASLPAAAQLGVILADGVASEMLYRGVVVGGLASWLRDRAYEGGATELVSVPSPIARFINTAAAVATGADSSGLTAGGGLVGSDFVGSGGGIPGAVSPGSVAESLLPFLHGTGELVTLDDASRWASGVLIVGALTTLAVQRVARSRRKVEVVADLRGRFSEVLAKQREQAMLKRGEGKGSAGSSSSSSSSGSSSADKSKEEGGAESSRGGAGNEGASLSSSSSSSSNRENSPPATSASSSSIGSSDATGGGRLPGNEGAARTEGGVGAHGTGSNPSSSSGGESKSGDDGSSSSSSSSNGSTPARAPPQPSAEAMLQLHGMVPPGRVMLAAGGGEGGGAGPGGGGGGRDGSSGGPQVVLDPLAWSTAIQSSRDLLQSITLVGAFVVSGGNLAASYVANVVNQTVFTILQERCAQRAKERSASMVQELEQFNEQLRRIAAKKKQQQEAAAQDGNGSTGNGVGPTTLGRQQQQQEQQQQSEAAQHSSAASTATTANASPVQGAPGASNTTPGAAAALEAKAAVHSAEAQPPTQGAANCSIGSSEVEPRKPADDSSVSRALSLLDTLLPEEQQQGGKK